MNSAPGAFEKIITCPVCLAIPARGTHAINCIKGHWVCGACFTGLEAPFCPLCRSCFEQRRPPPRNHAVEAGIEAYRVGLQRTTGNDGLQEQPPTGSQQLQEQFSPRGVVMLVTVERFIRRVLFRGAWRRRGRKAPQLLRCPRFYWMPE